MTNWVVAVPAWGQRCLDHLEFRTLPAIRAALSKLPVEDKVRFIIHTDDPERVQNCLWDREHTILPKPEQGENNHHKLGHAHRDVLKMTEVGEAIAFINADMVCSVEAFEAARKRLAEGKKLIMCMGTRTAEEAGPLPPIGAKSRDLLHWAWHNRHGWITGCIWGTGRTRSPTVLYFHVKDGVVLHAFHLHPFVVMKDNEGLTFNKVTIDADLVEQIPLHMIHVVTSADELSFAEMSPPMHDLGGLGDSVVPMNKVTVANFARSVTNHTHRWFFGHRIVILGDCSDMSDVPICSELLNAIDLYIAPPQEVPPWLSSERQQALHQQIAERRKPFEDASMFLVAFPVWGERHVKLACEATIPALREAMRHGGTDYRVKFMVYTDHRAEINKALDGVDADIRDIVPAENPHETLNMVHKQIITETPAGNVTVLMNADIIVSKELFAYGIGALRNGRRAIASMAPRVLIPDGTPIPIGVSGRELLAWVWKYRHPITESCVWGRMRTTFPNCFFFENGENVVMHSYHLHPFLVMKDRHCTFIGTIDDDLLANFDNHEIAWVENAEVGFAEISPKDYNLSQYGVDVPVTIQSAAYFARNTMLAHLRNFSKPLRVQGFGEVAESLEITQEIISRITPTRFHPPLQGGWESMPREVAPTPQFIPPLQILP